MIADRQAINDNPYKQCKKCNRIRYIDFFKKDRNGKDGYRNYCKQCSRLAADAKREKDGILYTPRKHRKTSTIWTQERLDTLSELLKQGVSRRAAAREMGLTVGQVVGRLWRDDCRHWSTTPSRLDELNQMMDRVLGDAE